MSELNPNPMQNKRITLLGAGLAGGMLALLLARRGFQVAVYERWPDQRRASIPSGRSINLAISKRGLAALRSVGLLAQVQPALIPMYGRCVHVQDAPDHVQPYSHRSEEHINAVSRNALNKILLEALQDYSNVTLNFQHKVDHIDLTTQQITLINEVSQEMFTHQADCIIAADGVNSVLRYEMVTQQVCQFFRDEMTHGYKELTLPAKAGKPALDHHYLHIWPRNAFMLIALPNPDGSFTCTLFLAYEGRCSFDKLRTPKSVQKFFKQYFPDVIALIPDVAEQFLKNPTGHLTSVHGYPWFVSNTSCLIGDAAHAMVPFYGQGMNCAFEDCIVLDRLIETHLVNLAAQDDLDWQAIFSEFQQLRKPNTDAITRLSLKNYLQMRDAVIDEHYLACKQIEAQLIARYPDRYFPEYHYIAFQQVPYAFAEHCGIRQRALLKQLLKMGMDVDCYDPKQLEALMSDYFESIDKVTEQWQ